MNKTQFKIIELLKKLSQIQMDLYQLLIDGKYPYHYDQLIGIERLIDMIDTGVANQVKPKTETTISKVPAKLTIYGMEWDYYATSIKDGYHYYDGTKLELKNYQQVFPYDHRRFNFLIEKELEEFRKHVHLSELIRVIRPHNNDIIHDLVYVELEKSTDSITVIPVLLLYKDGPSKLSSFYTRHDVMVPTCDK